MKNNENEAIIFLFNEFVFGRMNSTLENPQS